MITLPPSLDPLVNALIAHGYRPVVVGGFVRDALLGIPSKDIDIEVFGIESLSHLEKLLAAYGKVHSVGKSFGVVKLQLETMEVDFSVPRREEKTAPGHTGFCVSLDGQLSFEEAAIRRDFTINAIGYDLTTRRLLDPFGGEADLRARRLDIVNPATFVEDPLRLYRAAQFAARFELDTTEELERLARDMVRRKMLEELPRERIFEEIKKLLLKSRKPSVGFRLMARFGMLEAFPELQALWGVAQDPKTHAEGDVWDHTLMALDAVTRLHSGDVAKDLCLSLAALCHDLGKADRGGVKHEESGALLAERLLGRLSEEKALLACVIPLVRYHPLPKRLYEAGAEAPEIRRLALKVDIRMLVRLAEADFTGRVTPAPRGTFRAGPWLLERAAALGVLDAPLQPLLMGRDLVAAGLRPSERFKTLLAQAYEAQLDGEITDRDEALAWLEETVRRL